MTIAKRTALSLMTAPILVAVAATGWHFLWSAPGSAEMRTAIVDRGQVRSQIIATGTVRPVVTTNVSTQISRTKIASEIPLDTEWYRVPVPIAFTRQHQVGLQVLLDDTIQDGLLGLATGVRSRSTSP